MTPHAIIARVLPALITIVVVSLAGAGCASSAGRTTDAVGLTVFPAGSRGAATDIHGNTLQGGTSLHLAALRGHVVVVNVWASWCRPCRDESRLLAASSRRFAADGVRFVGIDERDDADKARAFAAAAGTGYPQLFDPSGRLLAKLPQLPQAGIPSTLVLDRSGRAAARIIGPVSASLLQRAVRAATGNR